MKHSDDSSDPQDFSLVTGGPFFQLLTRLHLTTPTLEFEKKRILALTLFAWLPLVVLSLIEGKAWTATSIPFFYDLETQARLLVALPLLLATELLVHRQLRILVGQFIDRNIISRNVLPKFKEAIASANSLRNSKAAELLLLIPVIVGAYYFYNRVGLDSWYSADKTLSWTGYWYVFVSRPLFQFIAFRWYFRIFVWARLLWQTSRLQLNLVPTHPDKASGLGFLSMAAVPFAPLIIAHGVLLAGFISNAIFFAGAKLTDFIVLFLVVVLFLELIILGPLLAFSRKIVRAQRKGLCEYGSLASSYVDAFDTKWLRSRNNDQLLGASDIQSLADLSNSFQVVQGARPYPFDMKTLLQIILFVILPLLPLLLTMIPLEQLLKKFFYLIF